MATATAMQSDTMSSLSNNKRKRESNDQTGGARSRRSQNTNGDTGHTNDGDLTSIQQLQLLQGMGQNGLQDDDNTQTARAALATPMQQSTYPPPDASFDSASSMPHGLSFDDPSQNNPGGLNTMGSTAQALFAAREATTMNSNKPAVGTPQWHQQRKDNHKEVERRRRETINEGINEIAKLVPNTEKNKGSILQSAIEHINELHERERKWLMEKTTIDQLLEELNNRNDRMRESLEQAWGESSKWQKRCRDAGLQFDDYDDGVLSLGVGEDGDSAGDKSK